MPRPHAHAAAAVSGSPGVLEAKCIVSGANIFIGFPFSGRRAKKWEWIGWRRIRSASKMHLPSERSKAVACLDDVSAPVWVWLFVCVPVLVCVCAFLCLFARINDVIHTKWNFSHLTAAASLKGGGKWKIRKGKRKVWELVSQATGKLGR